MVDRHSFGDLALAVLLALPLAGLARPPVTDHHVRLSPISASSVANTTHNRISLLG